MIGGGTEEGREQRDGNEEEEYDRPALLNCGYWSDVGGAPPFGGLKETRPTSEVRKLTCAVEQVEIHQAYINDVGAGNQRRSTSIS